MDSTSTESPKIRRFGLVAFALFGSLCGLGVWRHRPVPACLFGVLCLLGICLVLFPSRARPVYTGWLKGSHLLGGVFTGLILTLAYFLVITPSGWLKRLFGGRPLPVRPDRAAASYWVPRRETAQPRDRFLKRF